MRAGLLRHRITIQSVAEAQNSLGEAIETWSTFATVAASVDPISSRDRIAASQLEEPISYRARMRYLAGVTGKMRVVFDGVTYNIVGAPMKNAKRTEIELLLEELPHA